MFLGHVYSQLDLLQGDKVEGNSCYTITSSLHCAILQVFMWDHSSITLVKCVRTYVFYMLRTYVMILCNWLIL